MKVLVTSRSFGTTEARAIEYLVERGIQVDRCNVHNSSSAYVAKQIADYDALIVGNDVVDATILKAAVNLKVVHMHGTGTDAIDVEFASRNGILVMNAPGANRNAVAEMTVCLMLCASRKVLDHAKLLKNGQWERTPGNEISGACVGMLGLGNIGKRVFELLSGFESRCIAYDPNADMVWAREHQVELKSNIDDLFKEADFLILAAPLTETTERIVNERTLSLMKCNAYLINTARGGLIDEIALCNSLRQHKIAGVALDTFTIEPLPLDSPLRSSDAIITPHIAATSIETTAKVSMIVAKNIAEILLEGTYDKAVNVKQIIESGRLPRCVETAPGQ